MSKLIVVGSGIKSVAHLTQETIKVIQNVDKVLYLVNDDILKQWITKQANLAESLEYIYFASDKRLEAYNNISQYIVEQYKQHDSVCVVFYGHPTVFAKSALDAVNQINNQGGDAIVLPAVSSMDCLFSDLKIDPGNGGCFSIDATELLIYARPLDIHSHNILWQAACLGQQDLTITNKIHVLVDYLKQFYSNDQKICIYEAAVLPGQPARIEWAILGELSEVDINVKSSLYLPAKHSKKQSGHFYNLLHS